MPSNKKSDFVRFFTEKQLTLGSQKLRLHLSKLKMPKRTIKINLRLPSGLTATKDLVDRATKAAKDVVDESHNNLASAKKIADDLARQGIKMSPQEVLERKMGSGSGGARKRRRSAVRSGASKRRGKLTPEARQALIDDLKQGAKINEAAKKHGVSSATVTNVKSAAGLTRGKSTASK